MMIYIQLLSLFFYIFCTTIHLFYFLQALFLIGNNSYGFSAGLALHFGESLEWD